VLHPHRATHFLLRRLVRAVLSLALCLVHPALALAQSAPAAHGWSLGISTDLASFRGGAEDTTGGSVTSVRPGQALAIGVSLRRGGRTWDVALETSLLSSHIEAASPEARLQLLTSTFDRLRLAPLLGRRVASLGAGSLWLAAGPTLDVWRAPESDGRVVAGAQGRLLLRVPLGRVELENVVGLHWSSGPFDPAELPDGVRSRALRSVTVGGNLRLGL
jgi:hypothetical protein